jgi:hypothetical protein
MTNRNGTQLSVLQPRFGEAVDLAPQLGKSTEIFVDFCSKFEAEVSGAKKKSQIAGVIDKLRGELIPDDLLSEEELALLFAKSVILDLVAQGWKLSVHKAKISVCPPLVENETTKNAKEIIRNTHLLGRDLQLREKSVLDFVKGMERRRLTATGWHSVFSLMRDGRDLANRLQLINQINENSEKLTALAETISPYLQFVESDKRCEHTGLRLGDIWRYFRHTWVNEYKSVPGRSMMILIRDAAAPNHPVIGIAALGSSVVQHRVRDEWIGWHPEKIVGQIVENPTPKAVRWLLNSIDRLIADIYAKDLISEGIVTQQDLANPTQDVIDRLFEESVKAIKEHRKEPQRMNHNVQKNGATDSGFWESEAQTFLYRSKRCKQLAKLLSARQTFTDSRLSSRMKEKRLQAIFHTGRARSAVAQLVRMIKAEHVGIGMMDITVCGAIAPYNGLLGGKLVCMLLCSPEIINEYANRYRHHTSIIASAMKGQPVARKANLVLLCTTSLYGVGSSQYNRVKIPLAEIGLNSSDSIAYKNLGHSQGFGTYHFSRETIQLGSFLNSRKKEGRRVNSIFGEGVNPLMRKIRESLDFVGLHSEGLLQHGNKRVTYGIQLAENFREVLLGREIKPQYLIPQTNPVSRTADIANYWVRRWLLPRISNPEVLQEVSNHVLSYPPSHGAMVPLQLECEIFEDLT